MIAVKENSSALTVSSPDLAGGMFSREFTCDGANRVPRLQWSTPPSGTHELAIELPGPDAPGGTFPTGWSTDCRLASPAWRPCRPARPKASTTSAAAATGPRARGAAHHYHFVVLALDTPLGLAAGATRSDLESRLSGHVLARGELVATYQRA